jgi:FkbM family methyltransferase
MGWARQKLLRNIDLNRYGNIAVEAVALSDMSGREDVRFRSNWPLDGKHQPEANIVESIQFETLDAYTCRAGLEVDLIKLDVDGYEQRVLSGGLEHLRRYRPIIVMEVDRDNADDLVALLGRERYLPHHPGDGGRIPDLTAEIRSLPSGHSSMNVVFLPLE